MYKQVKMKKSYVDHQLDLLREAMRVRSDIATLLGRARSSGNQAHFEVLQKEMDATTGRVIGAAYDWYLADDTYRREHGK